MATKAKTKNAQAPAPSTEASVLDVSQTSVKKMIAAAKARGTITYDELNRVLPSDKVSPDQIEDVMAMLSEMGVNVVEDDGEAEEDKKDQPPRGKLDAKSQPPHTGNEVDRTDDPVRMYLREMGSVELLSPRGRDRHRQAHRGRPRTR